MTKTLTEQWRNEELPINLYYVIDNLGRETIGNDCGIRDMMVDAFNGGNIFIKEVLAPVPSYEEFQSYEKCADMLIDANKKWEKTIKEKKQLVSKTDKLEKKLEIATEALKKYQEAINHFKKDPMNNIIMLAHQLIYDIDTDSKQALEEMEGVK